MERNRNKVEVNEDMIKDIMAGDIPVFGKGKQTKSVADRTTSDPAEPDTKTKAEPVPGEKTPSRPKKRKDESNDYRARYLSPGNVTHPNRLISVRRTTSSLSVSFRLLHRR